MKQSSGNLTNNINNNSLEVFLGTTISISCLSDGVPAPDFVWYLPDGSYVKGSELTLSNVTLAGKYTCNATNTLQPTIGEEVEMTASSYLDINIFSEFNILNLCLSFIDKPVHIGLLISLLHDLCLCNYVRTFRDLDNFGWETLMFTCQFAIDYLHYIGKYYYLHMFTHMISL